MHAAENYFQAQTKWFLKTNTWKESRGFMCNRKTHFTSILLQKLSGLLIISNLDLGLESGEEKMMFDLVIFKKVNGSFSEMVLGCSPPLLSHSW